MVNKIKDSIYKFLKGVIEAAVLVYIIGCGIGCIIFCAVVAFCGFAFIMFGFIAAETIMDSIIMIVCGCAYIVVCYMVIVFLISFYKSPRCIE